MAHLLCATTSDSMTRAKTRFSEVRWHSTTEYSIRQHDGNIYTRLLYRIVAHARTNSDCVRWIIGSLCLNAQRNHPLFLLRLDHIVLSLWTDDDMFIGLESSIYQNCLFRRDRLLKFNQRNAIVFYIVVEWRLIVTPNSCVGQNPAQVFATIFDIRPIAICAICARHSETYWRM